MGLCLRPGTPMLAAPLPLHCPSGRVAVAPDTARGRGNPPAAEADAKPVPSHRRFRSGMLAVHRTARRRRAPIPARPLPLERASNRLIRAALRAGLAPRAFALLETTGRRTGLARHTPVGNGLDGDTFWLVAAHGTQADYVPQPAGRTQGAGQGRRHMAYRDGCRAPRR